MRGKMSKRLLTDDGSMRRIPSLKFWALEDVLVDKYCVPRHEARCLHTHTHTHTLEDVPVDEYCVPRHEA